MIDKFYNKPGVYQLINKSTGKIYIGRAKSILRRLQSHFSSLKKGNHPNKNLQEEFNQNGGEFTHRVYYTQMNGYDYEVLKQIEILLIKTFDAVRTGYNIKEEISHSSCHSPESIIKMAVSKYKPTYSYDINNGGIEKHECRGKETSRRETVCAAIRRRGLYENKIWAKSIEMLYEAVNEFKTKKRPVTKASKTVLDLETGIFYDSKLEFIRAVDQTQPIVKNKYYKNRIKIFDDGAPFEYKIILDNQTGIFYQSIKELSKITGIPYPTLYEGLNNNEVYKSYQIV